MDGDAPPGTDDAPPPGMELEIPPPVSAVAVPPPTGPPPIPEGVPPPPALLAAGYDYYSSYYYGQYAAAGEVVHTCPAHACEHCPRRSLGLSLCNGAASMCMALSILPLARDRGSRA